MLHALLHIPPSAWSKAPQAVMSKLSQAATKSTFEPKEPINWYIDFSKHHTALHRRITALLKVHNRLEQLFKTAINKKTQ